MRRSVPQTWFRAGGPAEVLFRPADVEDLAAFLAALPADVPVTVLGVGSNLLVRDGGIKGVVIRLMRGFTGIAVEGNEVVAGAGALDLNVALTARDHALAGLEFLSGIPGTIGGAVADECRRLWRRARRGAGLGRGRRPRRHGLHRVDAAELGFSYRHSDGAGRLDLHLGAAARQRRATSSRSRGASPRSTAARTESQPRSRTGGSTFVNPPGHKAWELIDRAGCRGLRIGDAQVSEKHCNFLINLGAATAADIEALGEEVRRRVLEQQRRAAAMGDPAHRERPA